MSCCFKRTPPADDRSSQVYLVLNSFYLDESQEISVGNELVGAGFSMEAYEAEPVGFAQLLGQLELVVGRSEEEAAGVQGQPFLRRLQFDENDGRRIDDEFRRPVPFPPRNPNQIECASELFVQTERDEYRLSTCAVGDEPLRFHIQQVRQAGLLSNVVAEGDLE